MDLGYSLDPPYRALPADLVEPAHRITAFLAGGGRAVVLCGPPRAGKRAVMDGLVAGMSGRVTRVENRAGMPFGLEDILRQMGVSTEGASDDQGLFFRTIAEQAYDDYSAVFAVEEAHTLSSLALSALSRVPGLGGPDLPGMILVLSGEPGLLEKLDTPGLDLLRNPRRTLLVELPGMPIGVATPPIRLEPEARPGAGVLPEIGAKPERGVMAQAGGPIRKPERGIREEEVIGWSRGMLGWRAVVLAMCAGAIAAAAGLTWSWFDPRAVVATSKTIAVAHLDTVERAEPGPDTGLSGDGSAGSAEAKTEIPLPQPVPLTPAIAAAIVAIPPLAAPPLAAPLLAPTEPETGPQVVAALPAEPTGRGDPAQPLVLEPVLRREFDLFLDRAGRDTARLSPRARQSLFEEYLQWRAQASVEPRNP